MATHLRDDISIESVADTCSAIAGGLDSDPQTKQLAPHWDAITAKADGLVSTKRQTHRTLARARSRLAVMDAIWDPEVAAFGRDMVDQSGGKRDIAPYLRFFKNVTPSAAQTFGTEREIEQGHAWIAELGRNQAEPIAVKWLPRLTSVTNDLADSSTNRGNALKNVALQNTAEELFIADVNREIDILEGELLKLFPGQSKRVAAFLEATRPSPRRSNTRAESETG